MKDKPIAVIITLFSGAIAAIICIIRGVTLLQTMISILLSMIVFLVIGLIANYVYFMIKGQIKHAEQEELNRIDRERREAALAAEEAKEAAEREYQRQMEERARERVANLYGKKNQADADEDAADDGDIWSALRS